MATPDWYSGTDATGEVAEGIEATIERMDARAADHSDIQKLQRLLSLEQEANWRSFLGGLMGTIHYDLDEVDAASRVLAESIAGYKAYLSSFDAVLSVYCQSCYTMGLALFDNKRYSDAIPYLLRCLPYMHEVYENAYAGEVYSLLDTCFSWISQSSYGLVFSEAAVFARKNDAESLERLMSAYHACGEDGKATEVFQLLADRSPECEPLDRTVELTSRQTSDSDMVN